MIKWIRNKKTHILGILRPKTIPSYDRKRDIIDSFRRQFNLNTLVETGTCLGDTVAAMKDRFGRVISIELSTPLAERARQRFADSSNVQIINGDSAQVLKDVLLGLSSPALIWLDGHYSSQFTHGDETIVTAKGLYDTPIEAELTHIFGHEEKGHVILIDDARLFTGAGDYPSMGRLRSITRRLGGPAKRRFSVAEDIIRITP